MLHALQLLRQERVAEQDVVSKEPNILHSLKELLSIMREDPAINQELPVVRRLVARTFAWLLFFEFYLVIQVLPVKYFIDEISQPNPSVTKLLWISASMVATYKLGAEMRRVTSKERNGALWRMWRVWWGYGHRLELRLSSDWHTQHSTGEKDSIVGRNVGRIEVLVDEVFFTTLPVVLRIIFTTILMFCFGWTYGLVAVLTNASFVWVARHGEKALVSQREEARLEMKALEEFGSEMTHNWRTIKSLGLEEEFSDENDFRLLSAVEAEKPRNKKHLKYLIFQDDVINLYRFVFYASIALTLYWQKPSLGVIVLATTWMEKTFSNFGFFSNLSNAMNIGAVAMKDLVALMLLPPTVKSAEHAVWPSRMEGVVEFDDVSFRYPAADDCTIQGFSMKVEPYTATAVVGESGCGKSTLISLLMREYDPSAGQIRIDGVDIRDLDYHRFRKEFLGVVGQQPQLFSRSIMENIRLGSPTASDQDVVAAAKLACAHEFITTKPEGYDSMIGENGINLSGGERQRLAIARALVRKPKILILDEATSALDAISQLHIQDTIDSLIASRTCTIFIVAHRWPTIMSADQVAVLQDGRLEQLGTHEELDRQGGLYKKLRDLESRGLL